jgi:hypothetical protein
MQLCFFYSSTAIQKYMYNGLMTTEDYTLLIGPVHVVVLAANSRFGRQ